jgi:low temperature requirement protein LtrA
MTTTALRAEENHRVGFAELFYDLVFVFAITQVSHALLYHYDLKGALQTAILFLAIWWVWIYTTWVLNRLDPDHLPVRVLLFGLMTLGLFMSMAIPHAFDTRGLAFALAFATMQVGRCLFMLWLTRGDALLQATFVKIGLWLALSGVFWIAGGLASPEYRMAFWVVALMIEYLGPVSGFWVPGLGRDVSTNWAVKGGHIAERCGLFVIICLGETLLVSGATFAGLEWDAPGMLAFLGAVAGTIGMWWVYFHIGFHRGAHQIETSDDPGRLARLAFTYAHLPIVAGVILSAVGSERAIAHPLHHGTYDEGLSLVGGVVLFLLGNGWFKRISGGWFPLSHWVGLGISLALFAVGPWLNLLTLNLCAAAILALVALWEHRSLGQSAH